MRHPRIKISNDLGPSRNFLENVEVRGLVKNGIFHGWPINHFSFLGKYFIGTERVFGILYTTFTHEEKWFDVLATRWLTNFLFCPNKILFLPTNSFIGPTKNFVGFEIWWKSEFSMVGKKSLQLFRYLLNRFGNMASISTFSGDLKKSNDLVQMGNFLENIVKVRVLVKICIESIGSIERKIYTIFYKFVTFREFCNEKHFPFEFISRTEC